MSLTVTDLSKMERDVLIQQYGRWLWVMRTMPAHAVHWLTGLALPPHERYLIKLFFSSYKENNLVCSRGTSKSFTLGSLSAPLKSLLYKNKNSALVSASGFRGGKLLFKDTEKLFRGELAGQQMQQPFLSYSLRENVNKPVKKDPSMWSVLLDSKSDFFTLPSNDSESLRGPRAHIAVIDERNTFDDEVVHAVLRPWLNVGSDFRAPARGGDDNQIFQVSTIKFTTSGWYDELSEGAKLMRREYEAHQARRDGDWERYDDLMEKDDYALKSASYSLTRFDYTDLLIPDKVEAFDGNTYEINYPYDDSLDEKDVLRWDIRDQRKYYYTYPVDKKGLENPLDSGTVDPELWLAEQRNVFVSAAGNVFTHDMLRKVTRDSIYDRTVLRDRYGYEDEFFPPLLFNCGDPCVIGMDYARDSDHTAFVVIRLGELSEGEFDPTLQRMDSEGRVLVGNVPWNNVIWAESHKKMTASDAADRLRLLLKRYHVIRVVNGGDVIRGIGLDKQGGGKAVADNLADPKPPLDDNGVVDPDWERPCRVYDPEVEDYEHYTAKEDGVTHWGALELIKPTNALNNEWAMGARNMITSKSLYIAKDDDANDWAVALGLVNDRGRPNPNHPLYADWKFGYVGIKTLLKQLQKIQREVTPSGNTRYVMPGNNAKDNNKKDLFSAFLYAVHMARQHLVTATKEKVNIKNVKPRAVSFQSIGQGKKGRKKGRRKGRRGNNLRRRKDLRRYKIRRN